MIPSDVHIQEEDLDRFIEQLKDEYEHSVSPIERERNLQEQKIALDAKLELAQANIVHATKAVQQMAEEMCQDKDIPINSAVSQALILIPG